MALEAPVSSTGLIESHFHATYYNVLHLEGSRAFLLWSKASIRHSVARAARRLRQAVTRWLRDPQPAVGGQGDSRRRRRASGPTEEDPTVETIASVTEPTTLLKLSSVSVRFGVSK